MTHVDWHPYPKEKPKKVKEYLLTVEPPDNARFLFIGFWIFTDVDGCWMNAPCKVIAWAEKPELYRPEEDKK